MTYRQFRRLVEQMVEEIPEVFLQDLQGVHVLEQAVPEDGYHDVWRMGEYLDPGPDDFLGGSDGLGRHVSLYYGSFAQIADADPEFDWHEEIWETLTHELQHHVESLAGDGRLIDEDVLQAQSFERVDETAARTEASRDAHAGEPASDGLGSWLRRMFGIGPRA